MKTRTREGFTLPVVMVAMTGLLVLLLGLVTIVGLERQSSKANADGYRAELAARSALAEARSLLSEFTVTDDYTILQSRMQVAYDDDGDGTIDADEDVERPYLFLAKKEAKVSDFDYVPLFSAAGTPQSTATLEMPDGVSLPAGDDQVSLRALPHEEAAVLAWRYVENEEGEPVARYAFWVEDMEGYLDLAAFADEEVDGERKRPNDRWPGDWPAEWPNPFPQVAGEYPPPWPAPGLNPGAVDEEKPLLGYLGLHTLSDPEAAADTVDFDNELFEFHGYAESGDSLVSLTEPELPLRRDEDGRLVDEDARQVEENLTAGNQPYEERALVPPVEGIEPAMIGEPKLNLNALLKQDRAQAVDDMASLIRRALPQFASVRKGGFHEDYEKTIAASAMDYADADSDPTVEEGAYRGVDSYPMINEVLYTVTFQWIKHPDDADPAAADAFIGRVVKRPDGRVHAYLTVELFLEVWNMSPHPCEGELTASYDEGAQVGDGGIGIGGGPSLRDPAILGRSALTINPGESGSIHQLSQEDGRWYFPPKSISLAGNEHRVVRMGAVKYRIDLGPSATTPFVRELALNYDNVAWPECRLLWNGKLVDWARELERIDGFDVRDSSRITANTLGSSYGVLGGYFNGNGDIRHGYYVQSSQNWSAFPANHSPNRRNVRYRIYQPNQNIPWGRVLPSEWPDAGHDANFGRRTFNWVRTENPEPRPDDPQLWASPPQPEPDRAPSRVSNLGRFYSETELGHVYDPAMWSQDPSSNQQIEDWARELDEEVRPSTVLGGGSTLRIGRPEHELYSPPLNPRPGVEAARLLDLFHAGQPFAQEDELVEGPLVRRHGHVNINTAPKDVLRALLAGELASDPLIGIAIPRHDTAERLAPRVIPYTAGPPRRNGEEADALADAIIAGRPYVSVSEVANVVFNDPVNPSNLDGERVFGNLRFYPPGSRIQWSDPAAEECFARLYNSATVRSRNFRVHVIGQAIVNAGGEYRALSTRRKVFRVFSDPGERNDEGEIDPEELSIEVIYEKDS